MKIDRLIGILSILLQQEKVTAPYLAKKFEVSRRTINRDIEEICKAGIPLVTTQGQHGGISIMEGYRLDRTVLNTREMQAILTGLQSLDSMADTNQYQLVMDKFCANRTESVLVNNHVMIDLSSWYKSVLAPKFALIQKAIENQELISFHYYAEKGEGNRIIEPYKLVFQWSSWYVWGYCTQREDFRLFKLTRMTMNKGLGINFTPRQLPSFQTVVEEAFPPKFSITARMEASAKWRLIDEYGEGCYQVEEDGHLLFQGSFTHKDNLLQWILGMGSQAELLEPEELRREIASITKVMYKKYE